MVTAIDQVLQNQYATNLANEFPKFTWNNYFMNDGTYNTVLPRVYKNLADPLGPDSQHDNWHEWELIRSWLAYPRKDWSGNDPNNVPPSNGIPNAGVLVDSPTQYPWTGPSPSYSSWVYSLGAGYFEFLGGAPIAPGSTLLVTLESNLSPDQANQNSRVSVLPILDFLTGPKPQNQFLTPSIGSQGPSSSRYYFRVANFDQCSRVTVIANNVGTTNQFLYGVTAQVLPPAPGTPMPACALILQ
jgi:hypothetical protein